MKFSASLGLLQVGVVAVNQLGPPTRNVNFRICRKCLRDRREGGLREVFKFVN